MAARADSRVRSGERFGGEFASILLMLVALLGGLVMLAAAVVLWPLIVAGLGIASLAVFIRRTLAGETAGAPVRPVQVRPLEPVAAPVTRLNGVTASQRARFEEAQVESKAA